MQTITLQFPKEMSSSKISLNDDVFFYLEQLNQIYSEIILIYDDKLEENLIWKIKSIFSFKLILPLTCNESIKSREMQNTLEDLLLENHIGRDTLLIAMGGGALSDLIGFVASIYLRGISFAIFPTTLLSMVDAAIGGKTGINIGPYKNYIGSFYPASYICIDFDFLKTLPECELISGMAEVIKYGLILHSDLFEKLAQNVSSFKKRDLKFLHEIIVDSILCKQQVIERDPKETGLRRILNFGHTFGHAIEGILHYQISHGEAVAIGLCMESYISFLRDTLSLSDVDRVYNLLLNYGFTLSLDEPITKENLILFMHHDKKSQANHIRCTLLEKIGKTTEAKGAYVEVITEEEIEKALDWFQNKQRERNDAAYRTSLQTTG